MKLTVIATAALLSGCGMAQQTSVAPPPNAVNSGPLAFMPCLFVCSMQTTVEDQYGNTGTVNGGDISNTQDSALNL